MEAATNETYILTKMNMPYGKALSWLMINDLFSHLFIYFF